MPLASQLLLPPPGLSDTETITVSRERRRFAMAAREVSSRLHEIIGEQEHAIKSLHTKVDQLSSMLGDSVLHMQRDDMRYRIDRLELLTVCSPNAHPTVDQVLSEAVVRKKVTGDAHSPERGLLREPESEVSPIKDKANVEQIAECLDQVVHFNIADECELALEDGKIMDAEPRRRMTNLVSRNAQCLNCLRMIRA